MNRTSVYWIYNCFMLHELHMLQKYAYNGVYGNNYKIGILTVHGALDGHYYTESF